jgi:hypothetical protein
MVQAFSRELPVRSISHPPVLPRVYADAVMPAVMNQPGGEDSVFALTATVTPDGNLSDIEFLQPAGGSSRASRSAEQVRLEVDLFDAVSTARFEPARQDGTPIAMNVVWVLTNTTVRGTSASQTYPAEPDSPALPWRQIGTMLGRQPSEPLARQEPLPVDTRRA